MRLFSVFIFGGIERVIERRAPVVAVVTETLEHVEELGIATFQKPPEARKVERRVAFRHAPRVEHRKEVLHQVTAFGVARSRRVRELLLGSGEE